MRVLLQGFGDGGMHGAVMSPPRAPPPQVPPPPPPSSDPTREQWLALLAYTGLGFAGALAALIIVLCACFASRGYILHRRLRRDREDRIARGEDPDAPSWLPNSSPRQNNRLQAIKLLTRQGVFIQQPGHENDKDLTWVGVLPSLTSEDGESPSGRTSRHHDRTATSNGAVSGGASISISVPPPTHTTDAERTATDTSAGAGSTVVGIELSAMAGPSPDTTQEASAVQRDAASGTVADAPDAPQIHASSSLDTVSGRGNAPVLVDRRPLRQASEEYRMASAATQAHVSQ